MIPSVNELKGQIKMDESNGGHRNNNCEYNFIAFLTIRFQRLTGSFTFRLSTLIKVMYLKPGKF